MATTAYPLRPSRIDTHKRSAIKGGNAGPQRSSPERRHFQFFEPPRGGAGHTLTVCLAQEKDTLQVLTDRRARAATRGSRPTLKKITLNGGSLGSWVDEERS